MYNGKYFVQNDKSKLRGRFLFDLGDNEYIDGDPKFTNGTILNEMMHANE